MNVRIELEMCQSVAYRRSQFSQASANLDDLHGIKFVRRNLPSIQVMLVVGERLVSLLFWLVARRF